MLALEPLPNVSCSMLHSHAQYLNQPDTPRTCRFDAPGVSQGGNSRRFRGVNVQMERLHTIFFSIGNGLSSR